jgi:hypothetical protein
MLAMWAGKDREHRRFLDGAEATMLSGTAFTFDHQETAKRPNPGTIMAFF